MKDLKEKQKKYKELVEWIQRIDHEIKNLFIFKKNQAFNYDFLLGAGIARRSCAITYGFLEMVKQKNSLCALALVRVQLDTMLRLYAGFFSKDRIIFSEEVLHGKQINKMLSDTNEKMTDSYLVKRVNTIEPWVMKVYKKTSGYIHFSNEHIKEGLKHTGGHNFEMVIGPNDYDREVTNFLESLACFFHITSIIKVALEDWLGLSKR